MTNGWSGLMLESGLRSTLLLSLAGLVSLLLRRRSAAERHLVWVLATAGALLLPVLLLAVPHWPVPVLAGRPSLPVPATGAPAAAAAAGEARIAGPSEETFTAAAAQDARRGQPLDHRRLLVWSWLVGAGLTLAPLVLACWRIASIARRATRLAGRWTVLVERLAPAQQVDPRRIDLRRAAGPVTPLTWGVLRPLVILPASCEAWSDAQAQTVLVHEIGHVRRHDCATQLLASAACVLYWFNPLVWLAAGRMLAERERACDDRVLLSGARASDYANDLLELARSLGAPWSTAHVTTAMARRSQIAGRLLAVLDPGLERAGLGRRSLALGLALALVVLLPLASATPSPRLAAAPIASSPVQTTSGASSPRPQAGPLDLHDVARELRARQNDYAAAFARRDVDALALFYTVDAQVGVPSFPVAHGRLGARSLLQQVLDHGVASVEVETRELYPVGDLVCELGRARFLAASGATAVETRFMTLWKIEDGAWHIHRDWATP